MKILPMKLTPRFVAGLLVAFFGMMALWALSPRLFGEKEFWDIPGPTWLLLVKTLGFTAGLIAGGRHWVCPVLVALAALAGQSLYVIIIAAPDPLLIVGLFMQVLQIMPLLIPAFIGCGVALLVSEGLKRLRSASPAA